jgi:hypothetical protein
MARNVNSHVKGALNKAIGRFESHVERELEDTTSEIVKYRRDLYCLPRQRAKTEGLFASFTHGCWRLEHSGFCIPSPATYQSLAKNPGKGMVLMVHQARGWVVPVSIQYVWTLSRGEMEKR